MKITIEFKRNDGTIEYISRTLVQRSGYKVVRYKGKIKYLWGGIRTNYNILESCPYDIKNT